MIYIISTGFNAPTKQKCIDSFNTQFNAIGAQHVYIEASEQKPAREQMWNMHQVIKDLKKMDVVVCLDGDDWFKHNYVLDTLDKVYCDPNVWLTYGQFEFSDGRPGFAEPYPSTNYRKEAWRATHLKTFRAGLFQKIKQQDLIYDGKWYDRAQDLAMMLPMLEMAGPEHIRFIDEILYVYNYGNSFEIGASITEQNRELAMNMHARNLPSYERLVSL
jgi:hypothetical protein